MQGHEAPSGYTVLRRLGSDASDMCLATEHATGRPVTLRFTGMSNAMVRDRLLAAVPTLRSFEHPHVIPFLDVVDSPSGLVVVLGAAEGGSLAGVLGARGVLPPGEVVTACAPAADGLAEAHRRGLIHGDLTLDDIVFTLDGRPMIAGVGLVQAGVAIRTRQRSRPIPPEVQAGSRPGAAADVYGLVTAAVAALTGYLPGPGVSLPHVAPAAEGLLVSALDPNPQRRPNAASVGNVFFAIAEPTPVELVLEEDQATTGSLPPVPASSEPVDDVAAYMRQSTSMGRRARRRAEAAPPAGAVPADEAAQTLAPAGGDSKQRREAKTQPVEASPAAGTQRRARRGSSAADGGGTSLDSPERDRPAGASDRPGGRRRAASAGAASQPRGRPPASVARTGRDDADAERSRWRVAGVDVVWIVSALVGVLLIAGAVIVGMRMFGEEDPRTGPGSGSSPLDPDVSTDLCGGPRPAPTAAPAEVADWTEEVQRLYTLRAQAFQEGEPQLLCQVHAPTNPVLAEDVALIEEYSDAGVRAEGLAFEVVNAELISRDGGRARVRITQRIPAYRLVDDDGNVRQEVEATPDETWEATFVAVADEEGNASSWRFG